MKNPTVIFLCALFAAIFNCYAQGMTIYVDAANEGSVTMDGSQGDPWDTITKGAAHLATVNIAPDKGGHTVLVAAGTYEESPVFTSDHAGVSGATNVLQADGYARLLGLTLSGIEHMQLEGFTFNVTGAASPFFRINEGSTDITVQNCVFAPPSSRNWIDIYIAGNRSVFRECTFLQPFEHAGIRHRGGAGHHVTVENCIFVSGLSGGIKLDRVGSELTLRNSILAGNRSYGLRLIAGSFVNAFNNIIYGNGNGVNIYFAETGKTYRTEEDLAELSEHPNMHFENTIIANPGFAGLHDAWNFNRFYENSPALRQNSGLDRDIGVYQDPETTPVLENTYFVNATGGDDSRTPAQARNEATPWLTIAKAAEHAIAGDTVIVKPGVYSADSIMITNGGSGTLPVIYKADGDVTVEVAGSDGFYLNRVSGVVLDGFRITGTPGGHTGGCIRMEWSFDITVQNCLISNFGSGGGSKNGIWLRNRCADIVVRDTIIHSGQYGIDESASSAMIKRCRIYNTDRGVSTPNPQTRIVNCAIYANVQNVYGGWFRYYDEIYDTRIEHSVLADAGTSIHSFRQPIDVVNTVFSGNTDYAIREEDDDRAEITVSYSCFHDNGVNYMQQDTTPWNTAAELNAIAGWSDNIVADPRFRNMYHGDFRLSANSLCINAGTTDTDFDTDLYGNPRLTGPAVDIGAYEMPYSGSVMRFF